jgi:hypothetical protein
VLLSLNDEMPCHDGPTVQEQRLDDTDMTCNDNCPSSSIKNVVKQTSITIEHLTYPTEDLMKAQKMRRLCFYQKCHRAVYINRFVRWPTTAIANVCVM